MHGKAKLQAKHYINTGVRQTVRKLYELRVSNLGGLFVQSWPETRPEGFREPFFKVP